MRKLLTGLALVAGVSVVAAASASAGGPPNVTCHSDDILTGTFHNVTVANGNTVRVRGLLFVSGGAYTMWAARIGQP